MQDQWGIALKLPQKSIVHLSHQSNHIATIHDISNRIPEIKDYYKAPEPTPFPWLSQYDSQ